jgi:hypothetical protein
MSFDPELEAFKTQIELRQYAASLGFAYDKLKSSRRSAVMRRGADKIIIKLNAGDGHFVYFTVHDERDNGSIIDFVKKRKGINLGEVRKELRPWIGRPSLPLPELPRLEESSKDRGQVEAEFDRMKETLRHSYLEGARRLPASLLSSARFKGCVWMDDKGNAVFPHADQEGICGFEKKNRNFSGFATGGEKALWFSRCRKDDRSLIFCESGIEALSHAVLFRNPKARYASIGGELNAKQPELIRAAVAKMLPGSEVVAAFNADQDGRAYADVVRLAVVESAGDDVRFTLHEPSGFKDWNDQLRGVPAPSFPTAHPSADV